MVHASALHSMIILITLFVAAPTRLPDLSPGCSEPVVTYDVFPCCGYSRSHSTERKEYPS